MTVTRIDEWQGRETGEVLHELLALHKQGKLTGFAFACKIGPRHHGIGLTDDYRRDPAAVLAVSARITHVLNTLIDHREGRNK